MGSARMNAFKKTRQKQKTTSTGKRRPFSRFLFKPKVDDHTRIWALPPFGDEGFYESRNHWVRGPKICTAALEEFGAVYNEDTGKIETWGKCVYCYSWGKAAKGSKEKDNLGVRRNTFVELIEFRFYHLVPDKDNAGESIYVPCLNGLSIGTRNKCAQCASAQTSIKERHFGGKKRWEMGKMAYQQFEAEQGDMERVCVFQHEDGELCADEVYIDSIICPKCEVVLVNSNDIIALEKKEVDELLDGEAECPKDGGGCGKLMEPLAILACDGATAEHPHKPEPANVFMLPFDMKFSGKKMTIQGKEKQRTAANYACGDFGNIEDALLEWGVPEDDIEAMLKPTDFHKVLRPGKVDPESFDELEPYVSAVLEVQAKNLGKRNPYATSDSGSSGGASRPFNKNRFKR